METHFMNSLFTTHDAGRILGIHPFTVGRWIDQGLLKAYRTAGGHRRVRGPELRKYLLEHDMPVPPELASSGGTKLKLLVVDDEQLTLNALRRSFKPLAAEVDLTMTTSAVDALLLLADLRPDAMLIDINMPELDGFEVCRRVRAFKPLEDVKLVVMTALYRSDIVGSALRAGAIACLAKPIDVKEVLSLISSAQPALEGARKTARRTVRSGRGRAQP
ncbi:MAG: DNA-binding response regulator [Myxococcaceae bacterium]|nr:DNA-binding response regulator [Myxococcaceae bacterium]